MNSGRTLERRGNASELYHDKNQNEISKFAETVLKKILDLKTTPTCNVRTTNKDTLSQAGPPTQGLSNNLDMGWRNASRSISQ
ncbi:hypothetical protein TNCV_3227801 [Trichonephila clavipes]|nr:hypothetical protein TNCV_3227801 [Trichonephila clavipes]